MNDICPSAPQEPIYDNSLIPARLVGFTGNHVPVTTTETIIIDGKEHNIVVRHCKYCEKPM